MTSNNPPKIVIKGAKTNNLKNISLTVPHHKFIVVTGLSGSGKSSLVFDLIAKEGQRRYFETIPSFARQFLGKLTRPEVDEIQGLSPVIAIGQQTSGKDSRSTVGTMSDIYDLLRLLYARMGETKEEVKLTRALFSFNSHRGKCPRCNGIGREEQIDLNRLIVSPEKTIRQGALAPTLPNGYIMYSQVTIDVLNEVCESEGFHVDLPWDTLSAEQKKVVLYGSNKIKVPFGKHSLESRLKWTGIKAKPREKGYYKGMVPIMTDILKRDRNSNILKYVRSVVCEACTGTRLNPLALSVHVQGKNIAELTQMDVSELKAWMDSQTWGKLAKSLIEKLAAQLHLLEELGLGHLTVDRSAKSLRASEIQRLRIANQILVPLSDVLYIFDEPSIGLHREENARLIAHFHRLVEKGNTVIVVEHDLDTISSADHILEIGPKAGVHGGEVVFNGDYSDFITREDLEDISPTYRAIKKSKLRSALPLKSLKSEPSIRLIGCEERNLKNINVDFKLGQLNVISGKSGTGKSSLLKGTLLKLVQEHLGKKLDDPVKLSKHENIPAVDKLIFIDHSPIGKTPRSNPATYLGISTHIRDLFASLPESKTQGYTKSRFSFNNKGGRCETCEGAGKTQIGMHFLGNVDMVCGTCNGDRFNEATLQIKFKNLSIAEVYKLSIHEAVLFFEDQQKVLSGLKLLQEIGLGYLTLGQSSTALSGGEAQRIKIANQLQKKDTGNTLYIIIEPSIGLHHDDIHTLLLLFDRIKRNGNTIVCIEQDEYVIGWCDWHIELGPAGGKSGGSLLYQGVPTKEKEIRAIEAHKPTSSSHEKRDIMLNGVTTHGLKNVDVRIPKNQLTVVTGVSGSGKSTLVYDTLFAESNARFTESLSTYNRSFLQQNSEAEIASFSGLGPAIGINRKGQSSSKRSTVGTLSGVYDAFRLLYSRIAQQEGQMFTGQHFSFNHHLGACPHCQGLGVKLLCDPEKVIVSPEKSIFDGAVSTNKKLGYYSDLNGQFMATLNEVAKQNKWDIDRPWFQLEDELREVILYGTGDTIWEVNWEFLTKSRTGRQELQAKWLGFCNYVDEEYLRTLHNKNTQKLKELLHEVTCTFCQGSRLKNELLRTRFLGKNIHELSQLSILSCLKLLEQKKPAQNEFIAAISSVVLPSVKKTLQTMVDIGLGYLSIDRSLSSLSGGERQRVNLAGQLSAQLFGVIYVLDEPTLGLDKKQVVVLSEVLKKLLSFGNTVVVVEHDPHFIKAADYLIEMGPGAGNEGGEVIFQGSLEELSTVPHSATLRMFSAMNDTSPKRVNTKGDLFAVRGAHANNLKDIDLDFYSKQIIAINGVSGSGKSSLVREVIYRSFIQNKPMDCTSIHGFDQFDEVLFVDQYPISQNRLSTPASYVGLLEDIKRIFSKLEDAKLLGFKRADFSYLSKKGRCHLCSGNGKLKISMDFMSDLWLLCDACQGARYNEDILSCAYQGKSIGAVLKMNMKELYHFFDDEKISVKLEILINLGLGHLILGQAGNTLSGGESQRLKLAKYMLRKRQGPVLYLFDEPSIGLHYFDIKKLVNVFESLVKGGDTVLFIEHNSSLIESADQVVTLGPFSGPWGGEVVSVENYN